MGKAPTSRRKAAAPAAAPVLIGAQPADTAAATTASQQALGNAPAKHEARPEGPKGELTLVSVSSVSPQGRRRAGQGFVQEPVELHVSDATLALLEGDPQLIVKRG